MIFKDLNDTDVVKGRTQAVTTGLWSNNEPQATQFFIASDQIAPTGSNDFDIKNGAYYYNVYNVDPSVDTSAEIQFTVAYGHSEGSGSLIDLAAGSTLPTKAIYNQYKNILLNPNDTVFTFSLSGSALTGFDSEDIWIINFSSNRFKERLDPGVLEFTLKGGLGQETFIDDSLENTNVVSPGGRVFNIVVGTLDGGVTKKYDSQGRGFGLLYPDVGIIILNPTAIAQELGNDISPDLGTDGYKQNHAILFNMIKDGANFKARSTEFISSRQYFIRVGNQEFNYSNNPTFIKSDEENPTIDGELRFPQFVNDPQVFITTVGLYNETNDLIAVAKLSQPIKKSFDEEVLIKIRLDF